MKRLLIVTPIFPPRTGGPATYTWELIARLKSRYRITVICFSPQPQPCPQVKIIALKESGSLFTRQLSLFFTILWHCLFHSRVYIQGPLNVGFVSTLAARFTFTQPIIKFVGDEVWEHARLHQHTHQTLDDYYTLPLPFSSQVKVACQRLSLKLCRYIITPSKYLKSFIQINHCIPKSKIIVINNAVKLEKRNEKKKKYQLVCISRLVPWKNIDHIIHAVRLARRHQKWTLIIIGEGPQLAPLKRLIAALNAKSWVKFTGRLSHSQTLHHLRQSQKLILYSDYEGQSHTLIEAMLCQTQIICSDIASNKEVTHHYSIYIPLNNIDSLARAINQPAKNFHRAYRYAQQYYNWNQHLKKLLTFL